MSGNNRKENTSSASPASDDDEHRGIDELTSRRICTHMNKDHGASVYGMVVDALTHKERAGKTLKQCKMTSISLENYTLEYVLCRSDACEMHTKVVPFVPPLKNPRESR